MIDLAILGVFLLEFEWIMFSSLLVEIEMAVVPLRVLESRVTSRS